MVEDGARDRTTLLPLLERIQAEKGYLPPESLEEVARQLQLPLAEVWGVATFYSLFSLEPIGTRPIRLCQDLPCLLRGSEVLAALLEERLGPEGRLDPETGLSWQRCSCLGQCDRAPALRQGEEAHGELTPASLRRLLEEVEAATNNPD